MPAAATLGGVSFNYSTPDKFNFVSVIGDLDLTVTAGAVTTDTVSAQISGTFGFEKTNTSVNGVANTPILKAFVQNASRSSWCVRFA